MIYRVTLQKMIYYQTEVEAENVEAAQNAALMALAGDPRSWHIAATEEVHEVPEAQFNIIETGA